MGFPKDGAVRIHKENKVLLRLSGADSADTKCCFLAAIFSNINAKLSRSVCYFDDPLRSHRNTVLWQP